MNNRFKCLLDEEPSKRGRREKERRMDFVSEKKIKEKELTIENNENNFPSLVDGNTIKNINQMEVSYGSILKNEEKVKKQENGSKLKKGWVQLGVKSEYEDECISQTKEDDLNEYLYFVDCMVNLYEHQRLEKIEILGEDNYERIYKFPNYDYEYFDKLDEKYEAELENEMEKEQNETTYGYNSDNSM